jgi:hypothetical protein
LTAVHSSVTATFSDVGGEIIRMPDNPASTGGNASRTTFSQTSTACQRGYTPNDAAHCTYAADWRRLADTYGLPLADVDAVAIEEILTPC